MSILGVSIEASAQRGHLRVHAPFLIPFRNDFKAFKAVNWAFRCASGRYFQRGIFSKDHSSDKHCLLLHLTIYATYTARCPHVLLHNTQGYFSVLHKVTTCYNMSSQCCTSHHLTSLLSNRPLHQCASGDPNSSRQLSTATALGLQNRWKPVFPESIHPSHPESKISNALNALESQSKSSPNATLVLGKVRRLGGFRPVQFTAGNWRATCVTCVTCVYVPFT